MGADRWGPLARLGRRRRSLITAAGAALLFALAAGGVLWGTAGAGERPYRPGEELEGLVDALDRDLPADAPRSGFTDATREAGVRFRHFPGRRTTRLPEDMGSGAAWGDYDRDGWLDLYVVNQSGPLGAGLAEMVASPGRSALFHNLGDGTFEEVGVASGVGFQGIGMGAAWGDYDADGHPDLFVTAYDALVLYRNRGDATFEDVTRAAGLDAFNGFWTGVSWADYDRDGNLDAYVTGYVRWVERSGVQSSRQYDVEQPASLNPSAFDPERNLLLRNVGDGAFTEVADQAGVAGDAGRSLAAAWADLDEDGWPDLYVANDVSDNILYRNLGDGTFEEISHRALVADYRGAMGIAVGDWDGDADADLFITHWIAQENALFDNQLRQPGRAGGGAPTVGARLRFMDEADRFGVGQVALDVIGWGTSFFDYDNDGRLDLMVVNGSTFQRDDDPTLLVPMRDHLFWNGGAGRGFYEVSTIAGEAFGRAAVGRGAAFGDYDNDGDVDVFVVNHGGEAVLLRNDALPAHAWLQVALEGRESNRSAVGARVRLVAGGSVQIREVGAQPSYLSQNSPVQHFGLGTAAAVDTLEVRWPAGGVQVFADLPVRVRVELVEGGVPQMRQPGAGAPSGRGADAATATDAAPAPEPGERARVLAFWRHYRAATGHRVRGRLEEAVAEYRRARELDGEHEEVLYYLGSVLLDLGAFDEAREALERLVEVNPRSARAHARLGAFHLCRPGGEDRLEDAEAALGRAGALNREETGVALRLAEVSLIRGDATGAERSLEAVLGSNPNSGLARALLGHVAWTEGRRDEATGSWRAAVEAASSGGDGLVSGEGDTSESPASTVRSGGACGVLAYLQAELDRAAGRPEDLRADAVERRYRALAARIAELRGSAR